MFNHSVSEVRSVSAVNPVAGNARWRLVVLGTVALAACLSTGLARAGQGGNPLMPKLSAGLSFELVQAEQPTQLAYQPEQHDRGNGKGFRITCDQAKAAKQGTVCEYRNPRG